VSVAGQRIGDYVIDAKLGQGGMGAVFRAHHSRLPGRAVALKVLAGDGPPGERALARFQREVQALAALDHPGIVKLHGGGLHAERPYYVMDLVEGSSLAALGTLPPSHAAKIVCALADAVDHIHARGVLHRDLKPDNVMVDAEGNPRLCDFGLAWLAESERLTRTGVLLGTPAFSPPELLAGSADEGDTRVDVYGLGAILYHAIAGRAPFEAPTGPMLLSRVLEGSPEPPSLARPGVAPDLDAICLKALARDPDARYSSVAALRQDLDRFLKDERVSARSSSFLEGLLRGTRRRGFRVAVAAALAVFAVGAGSAAYLAAEARAARRSIELASERALAPGQETATIREALGTLEGLRAPPETIARVTRRLRVRELEERLRGLEAGASARALLEVGEAALPVAEEANLVGEGTGPALGDLLLEGRDAQLARGAREDARALLEVASKLAKVRLEARPGDPAGRALRAHVALAATSAPRRPLGRGRLGLPVSEGVRADLGAAAALGGEPGARAAWLLVDLLAAVGSDTAAGVALEAARRVAPAAPAREALESVLAAPRGTEALAAGLAKLRAQLGTAPALARLFARNGAPDALEHVELADPAVPLAGALALDPPGAFALIPLVPLTAESVQTKPKVDAFFDEAIPEGTDVLSASKLPGAEEIEARFAPHRAEVVELLARVLRASPRDLNAGARCGHPLLGGLSIATWGILQTREVASRVVRVDEAFSQPGRDIAASVGRVYPAPWESPPGLGSAAACADFDARLGREMESDPLVAAARAGGVPEADLVAAREAASACRRIEALVEDPRLDEIERDRLAAEALLGIESFARLGGPGVLLFRARLRRLALPAPLGPTLAVLDLERAKHPGDAPGSRERFQFSVLAASEAAAMAEAGDARGAPLARQLYKLAIAWDHEEIIFQINNSEKRTRARLQEVFQGEASWIEAHRSARSLVTLIGTDVIAHDLEPTGEDVKRIGRPGSEFRIPEGSR
jgi:hypothetical protein